MSGFKKCLRRLFDYMYSLKRFLEVIACMQQLQVQENMVEFEKALEAVKVLKDQIQYRSQSSLNVACGYFTNSAFFKFSLEWHQFQFPSV